MQYTDKIYFMARVIKLLSQNEQMTLAQIRRAAHRWLKQKHQTDTSTFEILCEFVASGHITRSIYQGKVVFKLRHDHLASLAISSQREEKANEVTEAELIELGIRDELRKAKIKQLAKKEIARLENPAMIDLAESMKQLPLGQRTPEKLMTARELLKEKALSREEEEKQYLESLKSNPDALKASDDDFV